MLDFLYFFFFGDQTESDIDYYGDAENSSKESCSSADEEDEFHPVGKIADDVFNSTFIAFYYALLSH